MKLISPLCLLFLINTKALRLYSQDDDDYDFYKDNGLDLDNNIDKAPIESLLQHKKADSNPSVNLKTDQSKMSVLPYLYTESQVSPSVNSAEHKAM